MPPPETFVHLVDDDDAVRAALGMLLTSAGFGVKLYASGNELLDAASLAPGCIVTDLRMPGVGGLELIDRISALGLSHPVIVITGHGEVALAVEAMKRGAADFLEKPFDATLFLDAVGRAMAVQSQAAAREAGIARARQAMATLSAREVDVLRGLLKGASSKVIARDLGLSPRTVEEYRANTMRKLGAPSLSELIQMAVLANPVD